MPKVSVIIPTYNRANLIGRAIDSVLAQTYKDYEIIVVDAGSSDGTKEALAPYQGKIHYIYQSTSGISLTRNRGIQEAKGIYIAFLDSDDYWAPEKLELQVKVLDANPKVGIVYGRLPIVNEEGKVLGMKPAGISGRNFKELLEVWGDLPTTSVMTRRECLDKTGLFDPDLPTMEDIDLWLRIARSYEIYEIEGKTLAYYYRHSQQTVQDNIKVYMGLIKIYIKILKNYPEAPKALMHKRLAMNQYLLSRVYYDKKFYVKAWQILSSVLLWYPHIGYVLAEKSEQFLKKLFITIKPFGYWIICTFKALNETLIGVFRFTFQEKQPRITL
jgi:glycosyltransferase involved in cell wall biosynthesis